MATKKQISSLIAYSLNNDKEKVFEVAEDIAKNQKDKSFVEKINSMVSLSKTMPGTKGSVDVTVQPEKDYKDYLYESKFSEYTLDDVILAEKKIDKINNRIKELKNFDFLSKFKLPLQTRALFFGETGIGKTMTAYAIANELNKPILVLNLSSIISSKLGETSKNLNFVFKVAQEKDAIIFLDEIDFIGNRRDKTQDHGEIKRALLSLVQILDLIPQELIVISATNMIDSLDPAITRRFGLRIEFELPNKNLIERFLVKMSKEYSFSILEKSKKTVIDYLLGKNFHDIKNTILGSFKNKLLHSKTRKVPLKLSLSDIKKGSRTE